MSQAILSEKPGEGPEVSVTSVDDFFAHAGISRIDLIKIDVEGGEWNVLRGSQGSAPPGSTAPFRQIDADNLRDHGASPAEIFSFLSSLDYELYRDGRRISRRSVTTYPSGTVTSI